MPGEKEIVVIDSKEIPKSMPTMYDENYIKQSEQQKKIDYGPEHDVLIQTRL